MKTLVSAILIAGLAVSGACAQTKEETKAPKARAQKVEKGLKSVDESRGWLGVNIRDFTENEGVLVDKVVGESPAETAGIKENDRILEYNGKKIESATDLTDAVRKTKPGSKVSIVVQRDDAKKTLEATIGTLPREKAFAWRMPAPAVPAPPRFRGNFRVFHSGTDEYGFSLIDLTSQLGEYFEVPSGRGVLVEKVKRGSDAEKAGFKAGDVIVKIGKETVMDQEELSEGLDEYKEGEKVEFDVIRKGQHKGMSLEVKKDESVLHWNHDQSGMFRHLPPNVFDHDFQLKMQGLRETLENLGEKIRVDMRSACCE